MGSRNSLFLVTCLALTAGLVWVYSVFAGYFAENSDEKYHAQQISRQLQMEKFQRALAENRLRDFQQEVAATLPAGKQKDYALRNLSEVVRTPASVPMDLSGVVFERSKKLFGEKKYTEAIREFRHLNESFPMSPHGIESRFLLGEAAFLSGNQKDCLETVDLMMTQYPDHELTGFLMLRLGQLAEQSGRPEEALEVYQTVFKNFKTPALREQATRLSKAVESQ